MLGACAPLLFLLAQHISLACPDVEAAAADPPSHAAAADPQSHAAAMARLLPWLREEGVDVGPVAVARGGLVATRDIAPGEIYMVIPYRLALGPEHALRDPVIAPLLAQLDAVAAAKHQRAPSVVPVTASAKLRDCTLTLLHLLSERVKGAESRWYPYIAALPRHAAAFSECEPSAWMPPGLRLYCDAMQALYDADFEVLDAALPPPPTPSPEHGSGAQLPGPLPSLLAALLQMPGGAAFREERRRAYRWALGMALSRGQGPVYVNATRALSKPLWHGISQPFLCCLPAARSLLLCPSPHNSYANSSRSCWLTPGLDMHDHATGALLKPFAMNITDGSDHTGPGLHAGISVPGTSMGIEAGAEVFTEYVPQPGGGAGCAHEVLIGFGFIPGYPQAEARRACLPVTARGQVFLIDAEGRVPPGLLRLLALAAGTEVGSGGGSDMLSSLETAPPIVKWQLLALLRKLRVQQYGGGSGNAAGDVAAKKRRAVRPPHSTIFLDARCGGLADAPVSCATFETLWAGEQRVLETTISRTEALVLT